MKEKSRKTKIKLAKCVFLWYYLREAEEKNLNKPSLLPVTAVTGEPLSEGSKMPTKVKPSLSVTTVTSAAVLRAAAKHEAAQQAEGRRLAFRTRRADIIKTYHVIQGGRS